MRQFNDKTLYFDIETTGLSADISAITMIGCMDIHGHITQWFNEDGFMQQEILENFLTYANPYDTLVTFNGRTFDVPFLDAKIKEFHVDSSMDQWKHLDLYQVLRPYAHLFSLPSFKQKYVETLVNFPREDQLSGRKVVSLYQDYLDSKDSKLRDMLLLHNKDDVMGLGAISSLLSILALEKGAFGISDPQLNSDNLKVTLNFVDNLPTFLTLKKNDMKFVGENKTGELVVPIHNGQLYHYYSNPKDYYYLPLEDLIIPKSMASYVPKENREKATYSNCYTKFQPSKEFIDDVDSLYTFTKDTLNYLLRKDET